MEGTSTKPASGQAGLNQNTEEMERRKAAEQLEKRRITNINKVAKMLGDVKYVIENHSFAFLVFKGTPLSVSEYYPEIKVAVDKFHDMADFDKAVVEFKRKLFEKHKIRYGHLTPERSLADLHEELKL